MRKISLLLVVFFLILISPLSHGNENISVDPADEYLDIYRLYSKEELTSDEKERLLGKIERLAGIEPKGVLNREKTEKASIILKREKNKIMGAIENEDLINITGLYYIFFETATFYNEKEKFLNFYENGFYENRNLFSRGKRYYRILYFYLANTHDDMISKINNCIDLLNKNEDASPDFNKEDIKRLETIIKTSNEIKVFLDASEEEVIGSGLNFEKVFDNEEKKWIRSASEWFTNIDNFLAIYSYKWFRENLPESVSTALISDKTALNWKKQSMLQRRRLPLVYYKDDGKTYSTNIDKLFEETLKYLNFNNRQIDIIVISALKSWLSKQIKQGINVEDRLKYKKILEELNVSPSGWVFYNLYECRKKISKLRAISGNWDSLNDEEKDRVFKKDARESYFMGKESLDNIFSELTALFGSPSLYGKSIKKKSVNYIFHKYKGELTFYYEKIFFRWVNDLSKDNIKIPATDLWKDSVEEFRAAFLKEPSIEINHENLLKAYNLFLHELEYNGNIVMITSKIQDFMDLVEKNRLGSLLSSKKNNSYDIYHIFANTILRSSDSIDEALDISINSFRLADSYYRDAAERYGFVHRGKTGALNNRCTEIDDYQREFEFLKNVAEKSGKKIQLILSREKIQLYNKLTAKN